MCNSRRDFATKVALIAPLFAVSLASAETNSLVTAQVSFTSDYVFRGISQTLGEPAVQAGLDLALPSGFFAGLWASNVDFMPENEPHDGADLEMDYLIGYGHEFGEHWSAEAYLVRYVYPGTAPGVEYDYNELVVSMSFRWLSAMIGYSNDVFGQQKNGIAYQVSGEYPLRDGINLRTSYGYYDLSDPYGSGYEFYELGLSKTVGPVTLALAYYDTNDDAERLFGATVSESRTVIGISADF